MSDTQVPKAERRVSPLTDLEVRADDSEGLRFSGYAAVFNSLSEDLGFREVVDPGAFKKTLKERDDVRLLLNHDPSFVLARTKSGTLRLSEDDSGLKVEADLAPTSYARDLAVLLKRGDVSQMSFGFVPVKDSFDDDGVRHLSEVRLFDVSVVTYPAYEATSAEMRGEALEAMLRTLPEGEARVAFAALQERLADGLTPEEANAAAPSPSTRSRKAAARRLLDLI